MTQHFEVVYETKGVKVVNVWLAPNQELPEQWNTMTYAEQDEWLYEHQVHQTLNGRTNTKVKRLMSCQ